MAIEFNGSSDRIERTAPYNWAAQAQTYSIWTWWDNLDATTEYIFNDQNVDNTTIAMIVFRNASESTLRHTIQTDGAGQVHATGNVLSTGAWIHIALTWNGLVGNPTTDHVFYVNGVSQSSSTTSTGTGTPVAATGINSLGYRHLDATRFFDGRMAEAARWTRVLSTAEITALSKGFKPSRLPNGLKFYMPLVRSVQDYRNGTAFTVNGTTVATHPTLIIP
jgi:hypothetical protein